MINALVRANFGTQPDGKAHGWRGEQVQNAAESERAWQVFAERAFAAVGLPEVDVSELKSGSYTNAQIAQKLRYLPNQLLIILMGTAQMGTPENRRDLLSAATDEILKTHPLWNAPVLEP